MDLRDFLMPSKGKLTIFLIIVALAFLSFLLFTPCNPVIKISNTILYSAFTCTDSPQSIGFIPGLYPPILFEERLTLQNGWVKETNSFGFSCATASCGECLSRETTITASCSINPIAPVYVIIYWYLLSCVIALVLRQPYIQVNGKKIAKLIVFLILWFLFLVYLIGNLLNGTWGISLNPLGLTLVLIPLFVVAYFILKKLLHENA